MDDIATYVNGQNTDPTPAVTEDADSVNSSKSVEVTGTVTTTGVVFDTVTGDASSNTLDDYEEGTWTPTSGSATTFVIPEGNYTKIGDRVFIQGYFEAANDNSILFVGGLPFAPAAIDGVTVSPSLTGVESAISVAINDWIPPANHTDPVLILAAGTGFRLSLLNTTTGVRMETAPNDGTFSTGEPRMRVGISGVYRTTA